MTKDERIAELEHRVAELEDLLGTSQAMTFGYRVLGISARLGEILGLLMKRTEVSLEQMYIGLYGALPEGRQPDTRAIVTQIFFAPPKTGADRGRDPHRAAARLHDDAGQQAEVKGLARRLSGDH